MRNITITVDERTAAWVRVYAAEREKSVSRVVGELLEERMNELREYDAAMRRFLRRGPVALKRKGASYPQRHELHERARLR